MTDAPVPKRWRIDFYHERRAIMASVGVDAVTPAAAVLAGRRALLTEYPAPPPRRPKSLFEQAQRLGEQDLSAWVLYRIANDANAKGGEAP